MNDYIIPHLEWEVLQEPIVIPEVDNKKELPQGQNKIVITRDENYNLRAVLSTEGDHKFFAKNISAIKPFTITDSDDRHYTLESCRYVGYKCWGRLYEVDLSVQGLKIRPETETDGVWLTEWCLNGPKSDRVFRNSTTRKMSKTILRERLAHNDEKIHSIEVSGEDPYTARDYLRIETDDFQFLITKVPEGIGPDWYRTSNIGIEYREDWKRIPDGKEREQIRELCSFIFGRQLLLVGYTRYDKDGNIVKGCACNPWGNDPRYQCSTPPSLPITIEGHTKADDLISQLLPTYCKLRDDYHLDEGLRAYWLARTMPIGLGLPTFAAGVEAIMNGWFGSEILEFDGNNRVYMDKDEFKKLFRDELSSVEGKLSKCWFSWNNIPGDGNERFIKLFRKYFDIDWVENAKIYKSDDGKTIHITDGENSAEITIYKAEGKTTLKISDGSIYDLKFKGEGGKRNIYIETRPYAYKIMNNLQNAYKMGVMDQFRFFFDKIDLVLDDDEWNAIKARNGVAHGRFTSEESGRMFQYGLAYTTIIHKILLRLIGYSGRYIDHLDGRKEKLLKSKHDQADAL